jgi:hypothetical protein
MIFNFAIIKHLSFSIEVHGKIEKYKKTSETTHSNYIAIATHRKMNDFTLC